MSLQVESCVLSLASRRMEQAIIESRLMHTADPTTQHMMADVLALRQRVHEVRHANIMLFGFHGMLSTWTHRVC